jgi:endo-1,4-beta-xylanase
MKRFVVLILAGATWISAQTLRELADQRGIAISTAAQSGLLSDSTYATVLAREYNTLEPENDMKWGAIQYQQGVFDFSGGDALVNFAQVHGMRVRGHNLLWHAYNPSWLVNSDGSARSNFTPAQLSQILHNHITAVAQHFAGKVYAWDVVNEAFSDGASNNGPPPGLRDSLWYNKPGIGLLDTAYIEQAFRWAHEADPAALLFYNDYSTEGLGAKSDLVYKMAKDFRARGVPLDGIGLQLHVLATGFPENADIDANIARLSALGLQVHITELDVRIPAPPSANDLAIQAARYQAIAQICLKYPACTAIQTWGFTDAHSWIPSVFKGYGAALPFDAAYQPKPSYTALLNTLKTTPAATAASGIVNAAGYQGGGVSPGEIVTWFGPTFGPAAIQGLTLDARGKVATSLSGVRILFDGTLAPIIYSLVRQSSVVVPFSVKPPSTQVVYEYNGVQSAPVTVPVVAAVPGVFTLDSSGTGPGAILNQDNSVNSASRPAAKGSIVILYATGGGVTTPALDDGDVVSGQHLLAAKTTVTIGGQNADVQYAGAAPGLVAGVVQVNVVVSASAPSGAAVPVSFSVGGAPSQSTATVTIQ